MGGLNRRLTSLTKQSSKFPVSDLRSSDPVRELSASDLGIDDHASEQYSVQESGEDYVAPDIAVDDPILGRVQQLLRDGYSGILFVGPPGTGKSWYADGISRRLVDFENHSERRRLIQFHHSYQYEDFVEGFIPKAGGGFELVPKHFIEMCEISREISPELCVLVIDELSRTDPRRVFGEVLTYLEADKREIEFHLASGRQLSVPRNLVVLATMNPLDRGADQVDAALERRFAKIPMEPNIESLHSILTANEMAPELTARVIDFFTFLLNQPNQHARIGHAYFIQARDAASLRRLWQHQLMFHMQRAFQLNPEGYSRVETSWNRVFASDATEEIPSVEARPEIADDADLDE